MDHCGVRYFMILADSLPFDHSRVLGPRRISRREKPFLVTRGYGTFETSPLVPAQPTQTKAAGVATSVSSSAVNY